MKKIFAILLCFIMIFSFVACGKENVEVETDPNTESVEEVFDINEDARAMLEEAALMHTCDEDFVDTILTQVPDIFLLEKMKYACNTFFLELTCGTEFIVIVNDEGTIETIAYWFSNSNQMGHLIYEAE